MRYVALLRGINVGGKNLIPMADLKSCFEREGFARVSTYIQSGNVLFDGSGKADELTERIERALSARFGYAASVVLRSRAQMRAVVERAPRGFGTEPGHRYDVLFLKPPLTAGQVLRVAPIAEGVDRADAGTGVVYWRRLDRLASRSRLSRLASMPVYQRMTVRNWNTTTRLSTMLDEGLSG